MDYSREVQKKLKPALLNKTTLPSEQLSGFFGEMKGTLGFLGNGQDNYTMFNLVQDGGFINVDLYCSLQALKISCITQLYCS